MPNVFQIIVIAALAVILVYLEAARRERKKNMSALGTQLGRISTGIDKLVTDLGEIKDLVSKLQTSDGPISPEDQATLDALETKVNNTVTEADAIIPAPPAPTT